LPAVLRRYLTYGYENIFRQTKMAAEPVYLARYGTLMTGEKNKLPADDIKA